MSDDRAVRRAVRRALTERYTAQAVRSRLEQAERAIAHGLHRPTEFERDYEDMVLTVRSAGREAEVSFEESGGVSVSGNMAAEVENALRRNGYLAEGRLTTRELLLMMDEEAQRLEESTGIRLRVDVDSRSGVQVVSPSGDRVPFERYIQRVAEDNAIGRLASGHGDDSALELGVPSTPMERAAEMLPASAFRRFTELLRADRYELASSALARAVKDEDVEITDDIRELYTMLTRVRLKGEGPGAEELPQRQYEAAIRREVRRALSEAKGFSGSEYGLEAPEDADYELVRVERGDTDKEAFMRLKRWAEDNGYTVSPGERESYLDYRFEKGGETYRATKTR